MKKILDVGCGNGRGITAGEAGARAGDFIVGVDVNFNAVREGKNRLPCAYFIVAQGECLPLRSNLFDSVICRVALPCMDIPRAVGEMCRVLKAGGTLDLHLHNFQFALSDFMRRLRSKSVKAVAGGAWAIVNGFAFTISGKCLRMPGSKSCWDSWQSARAMRLLLKQNGLGRNIDTPFVLLAAKQEDQTSKAPEVKAPSFKPITNVPAHRGLERKPSMRSGV